MKLKNIIRMSTLLMVAGVVNISCSDQWGVYTEVEGSVSGTTLDAIEADAELSRFCSMLKNKNYGAARMTYAEMLAGSGNYTVLAPTNAALSELESLDTLTIIENHIARLSYKGINEAEDKLMMMNNKKLTVSEVGISPEEIICSNGVLRKVSNVVLPKPNLYEMLVADTANYEMARLIVEASHNVMDVEKSVQIGVDQATGQAIYDTVWMVQNAYLDSLHINNEDSIYTLLLLDDANFKTLQRKFVKYMYQLGDDEDSTLSYAAAASSLIHDLVCRPADAAVTVLSSAFTDVDINMDNAAVSEERLASNGNLLVASGADIRLRNNKIKDVIVEGEDYLTSSTWTGNFGGNTYVRMRDYASGGRDVMLAGFYRVPKAKKTFTGIVDGKDSTYTYPVDDIRFYYSSATNNASKYNNLKNAYLSYRPHLYSCQYKVYWVANDDIESHYAGDTLDLDWDPTDLNKPCSSVYRVIQKLVFGQEGKRLIWNNGAFENVKGYGKNANKDGVMLNIDPAQVEENKPEKGVNAGFYSMLAPGEPIIEQPLRWHQVTEIDGNDYRSVGDNSAVRSKAERDVVYILAECDIDVFVANSWDIAATNSKENGMIFLDYIRFEPVIEEEMDENGND